MVVKYLTKRYITEYDPKHEGTFNKQEFINNQDITIRVMDTYDEEECSNSERYLDWADAYVVVYSITDRKSLASSQAYLDIVSHTQCPVTLVGNKADLEFDRNVARQSGERTAKEYSCTAFFEVSACDQYSSVAQVFKSVIEASVNLKNIRTQEDTERRHISPSFRIFNKSFKNLIFN